MIHHATWKCSNARPSLDIVPCLNWSLHYAECLCLNSHKKDHEDNPETKEWIWLWSTFQSPIWRQNLQIYLTL